MAAEPVVLAIGMLEALVEVALVRRHADHSADAARLAHRLQDVGGADDVDRVDGRRVLVAALDGGQRGEVEDDLGARVGDCGTHGCGVGHVASVAAGEAGHLGAEGLQPQRQPAALEAGVAGDEDAPPGPERRVGRRSRHPVTLCDDPAIATVRILGAGGWIPTGTHATCSALLREGDAAVLIDAGTGIERLVVGPLAARRGARRSTSC